MKIVFATQLEEIHSSIVLRELAKTGHEVVVITSKTLIHKKSLFKSIQEIIKKSGFTYFFMRASEGIYIKFYSFFRKLGVDRFKPHLIQKVNEVIAEEKLRHLALFNVNAPESMEKIEDLGPDLIISCVFNQIFSKKLIEIPKYGCVNIHRSLLPEYRGVSPTFWALANNEETTGITIHQMTEKIDVGGILAQKEVSILKEDTVNTLSFRLMKEGARMLCDLVETVEKEKKLPQADSFSGKYYGWPTKEAVKRFRKNKRKVF